MILSFNKIFAPKIVAGTKIHTIRADKGNRWKAGNLIHGAMGVRTKKYSPFFTAGCLSTQKFSIKYDKYGLFEIRIDCKVLAGYEEIKRFVQNDGFETIADFIKWFDKDFEGKIIHWTKLKY